MRKWLEDHGQTAATLLAAIAALSSFLFPAGLPARWAATAVVLLALPRALGGLGPRLEALAGRFPRLMVTTRTFWPYLLVTAVTLVALGPVTLGDPPISQDHANHYLGTHILVKDLLPTGRLFGWTDRLGAGYPMGDLYPTAVYLVTGFAHLVTFGLVSLPTSYAFGMVVVWLLPALAVVALARRMAGGVGASLAGIAMALDAGGDREGGWTYAMFHGVWPQTLGTGLWLLALLALWRLAEKGTTRRLATAALLVGLGLWAHPMNSLVFVLTAIVLVTVRLAWPEDGAPDGRGTTRLVVALAAGGAIGLGWVARMLLAGEAYSAYGCQWGPLRDLAGRLLDSGPFDNQIAAISVLALVGAVQALQSRSSFPSLVVLLGACLLAIGSMDLVTSLDLGLVGSRVTDMQFRRFSIPLKPLWYALAGAGLSTIGRGLRFVANAKSDEPCPAIRPAWARIVSAAILAPVAWAFVAALPGIVRSPAARPLTLRSSGEATRVEAITERLRAESAVPGIGVHRAVYWEKPGYGGRYPLFAIADAGWGFLPTKIVPANNFRFIDHTTDTEAMARLGASAAISRWPIHDPRLEEMLTVGVEHIYRIRDATTAPARMEGPGHVEIASRAPEEISLRVTGAGKGSSLVVDLPPYRKWRASQNGRELPLSRVTEHGLALSSIRGVTDGEVRLVYRDDAIENAVLVTSAVLILACLAGLVARPRSLRFPWSPRVAPTADRLCAAALVTLVSAALVAAAVSGRRAASREWLEGERGFSLASVLHREGLASFRLDPARFCVASLTRDPKWGCSEHDLAPRLVPASARGGRLPSCLAVGVPPSGHAFLGFDLPTSASRIKGRLHARSGPAPSARVVFGQDRTEALPRPAQGGAAFALDVPAGTESLDLVFEATADSTAEVCVELVALRRDGR